MLLEQDVIYVVSSSGQSLAFGVQGTDIRNPRGYYSRALMLGSSVHSGGDGNTPLPPNLELQAIRAVGVESMHIGYAAHVSAYSPTKIPPIVWIYNGVGGQGYLSMRKGTVAFEKAKAQLRRIKEIANREGRRVVVLAADWISGENDSAGYPGDETYSLWMQDYYRDINKEFAAITGQTSPVKIVWCQTASHTFYYQYLQSANGFLNVARPLDQPTVAAAQLRLASENPDKFILAGPKYHYQYAAPRSAHLSAYGYEMLGRKRGEILLRSIIGDEDWKPLSPIRARMVSSSVVQIDYNVMFAPIILDTQAMSDPGNFGFGYEADGGNNPVITNVEIAPSGRSILLTLSRPPLGLNRAITYAWRNAAPSTYTDPAILAGVGNLPLSMGQQGPRGCLRDSSPTVSFGEKLYNWAVHSKTKIDE
jgi:hypothetical protein